ncbi:MAG: hypothetical protein JWO56_837 [Acidobacteria bacterium]|nr:hypothetical protein [Acidobacteriota bacterium]
MRYSGDAFVPSNGIASRYCGEKFSKGSIELPPRTEAALLASIGNMFGGETEAPIATPRRDLYAGVRGAAAVPTSFRVTMR